MPITRLSGGSTPADGSDPRTFPAIWNPTAGVIEANETDIAALQALVGDNNLNDINDVAITTPADGQFLVYDNGDWVNSVPAGGILQVVQAIKTDTFTVSTTGVAAVTGLSATITPTSSSSKVLVIANVAYSRANGAEHGIFRLTGGNTSTYRGDSAGSRTPGNFGGGFSPNGQDDMALATITYVDSPATTSATTYGVEVRAQGTSWVNRSAVDGDQASRPRGASNIILMEVAG